MTHQTPRARPPSIVERLLAVCIPSTPLRESVLGDLHEEFVERAQQSPALAMAWYCGEAASIALRLMTVALVRRAPGLLRRSTTHVRGDSLMRTLGLEVRHACRIIAKRPGVTAILILTMALGLGANAAIFSLIDALVLRPFTIPGVDRVVMVTTTRESDRDRRETVSPADFLDFKRQTDVFEHFAAFAWWDANLVGRDEAERALGFRVSADFFPALGVVAAHGRNFHEDEEAPGRHLRVILSHALWARRFAADPSVVGQTIQIDGQQYEVVGVAPEGFEFPMRAQLWAPLAFDAETAGLRRARYLSPVGRLAHGRTLEEAQAQLALIGERLEQQDPETNRGLRTRVYTLAQGMLDIGLGPILSLWQASACFVLLIACANVANLLLARGAERQREVAVRLAIGASRARIIRELLIESVLIALAAVPAALAVAWIGLRLLRDAMPAKIARFVAGWQHIDVDGRLFAFTTLLALAAAVMFGLIPSIQASRSRLAETLKDGGRSMAVRGRSRLRRGLVVAEMALALPLLVACGVSAVSVHRFLNGPQGYRPDGLLTLQVVLGEGSYPNEEARRRFADRAVRQLAAVPGVQTAAAVNNMPAGGSNSGSAIEIEGKPNADPANAPRADYRTASPEYFDTLGIPILTGRPFTPADRSDSQPVVIVSQSFARRHWPDEDPLGRRLRLGSGPWLVVVGISGDVIHDWFARRNSPTVYRPLGQATPSNLAFVVRTAGAPSALAADVRHALRAVDPAQPAFDLMTMREALLERTLGLQFVATIMVVFGATALLLAVVGVYGVTAHMITQRTHEIGVRMALGATRGDVLRLAVSQAGRLTAAGAALGVILSLALGRLIEAGLLGVATADVRFVAAFAALLIAAALTAGYLPARRAATVNPMDALRAE